MRRCAPRYLLDGAVDYAVANGISDLSLRPLAAALGTQAPVLLHHFGTKEQLIVERVRSCDSSLKPTDSQRVRGAMERFLAILRRHADESAAAPARRTSTS